MGVPPASLSLAPCHVGRSVGRSSSLRSSSLRRPGSGRGAPGPLFVAVPPLAGQSAPRPSTGPAFGWASTLASLRFGFVLRVRRSVALLHSLLPSARQSNAANAAGAALRATLGYASRLGPCQCALRARGLGVAFPPCGRPSAPLTPGLRPSSSLRSSSGWALRLRRLNRAQPCKSKSNNNRNDSTLRARVCSLVEGFARES